MGVIDSILNMVSCEKLDNSIKLGAWEVLSRIFIEKKIVWKYMQNNTLISSIKAELFSINLEVFPELPFLKKNILKCLLKIMGFLCENEKLLDRLFEEKTIEIILDILLANKEKIDIVIAVCEVLGSFAKKSVIIKEMLSFGVLELLMEFYDKYLSNLDALRAFARLIGELASNSIEAQEKFWNMSFHYLIIEGVKLYQEDQALINSSCVSLSFLCYNNVKISEFICKSEIIKPICLNLMKNFDDSLKKLDNNAVGDSKELMGNIALLISNLCYKNNQNKQILGSFGVVEALVKVLSSFAKKGFSEEKSLKNCLKYKGKFEFKQKIY